jgi:hypothetical protein
VRLVSPETRAARFSATQLISPAANEPASSHPVSVSVGHDRASRPERKKPRIIANARMNKRHQPRRVGIQDRTTLYELVLNAGSPVARNSSHAAHASSSPCVAVTWIFRDARRPCRSAAIARREQPV